MKPFLTRRQKGTICLGMFCMVSLMVVLQLWLLTTTMNAFMGGDDSVEGPAAIASFGCLLVNLWLLRRLRHLERTWG